MKKKGNLYLVPNLIAESSHSAVLPAGVPSTLKTIRHFLAEDIRSARRYLSSLKIYEQIELLNFDALNKDTSPGDIPALLNPLTEGENMGVISESGCPGIADPGALAVMHAHTMGVKVIPLVGPSSILLALMASGLNGQHFAFHGYVPVRKAEATEVIRQYEVESFRKNQTQIFIETPYRNNQLFSLLLQTLKESTTLCVALDLTGKNEFVMTKPVSGWRNNPPEWPKLPAVFLFLSR